jgi:hypothetical protein
MYVCMYACMYTSKSESLHENIRSCNHHCLSTACTTMSPFLFAFSSPEDFIPYGTTSCVHWSRICPTAIAISILFTRISKSHQLISNSRSLMRWRYSGTHQGELVSTPLGLPTPTPTIIASPISQKVVVKPLVTLHNSEPRAVSWSAQAAMLEGVVR